MRAFLAALGSVNQSAKALRVAWRPIQDDLPLPTVTQARAAQLPDCDASQCPKVNLFSRASAQCVRAHLGTHTPTYTASTYTASTYTAARGRLALIAR